MGIKITPFIENLIELAKEACATRIEDFASGIAKVGNWDDKNRLTWVWAYPDGRIEIRRNKKKFVMEKV